MPSPLDQPEQPTPSDSRDQTSINEAENVTDDQPPQPLAIDFGESSNAATEPQTGPIQALDVGDGDAIKLDALGPIIVNNDGVSPSSLSLGVRDNRADLVIDFIENTKLVRA